jgi:hypothetical protein
MLGLQFWEDILHLIFISFSSRMASLHLQAEKEAAGEPYDGLINGKYIARLALATHLQNQRSALCKFCTV